MVDVVPPARVRCREIGLGDLDDIANLLTIGFATRTRDYWVRVLRRLSEHVAPPGLPKYGYLLESNGAPVGVIVLIFSLICVNGEKRIRCNVSSWYVAPSYRSYATMLVSHALKHKHVTYFNITPSSHTLPILEAQGYQRYCNGWFVAAPALSLRSNGAAVRALAPDTCPDEKLPPAEIELLSTHASYGCMSLICHSAERIYPFVFAPRRGRLKYGLLPFAQLVYCRDQADFVRFAGPLGRFLAWRGFPLVLLDSNGPVHGLVGAYFDNRPKYFKGPDRPRLGDLAYSELAMFEIAGDWIWKDWRFRSTGEFPLLRLKPMLRRR
jgi:hypothetical protein